MSYIPLVLTLNGSIQNLATAYQTAGFIVNAIDQITLQPAGANANPVYVGGTAVSSTAFGQRLLPGAAGVPPAPYQDETRQLLGSINVIGTNTEKLHISVNTV